VVASSVARVFTPDPSLRAQDVFDQLIGRALVEHSCAIGRTIVAQTTLTRREDGWNHGPHTAENIPPAVGVELALHLWIERTVRASSSVEGGPINRDHDHAAMELLIFVLGWYDAKPTPHHGEGPAGDTSDAVKHLSPLG